MTPDREEKIRQRAYELWEAEGRPDGKQQEHWERAAREIEAEEAGESASKGSDSDSSGLPGDLQAGGTMPGSSPDTSEGSFGNGGGAGRRGAGNAKRAKSPAGSDTDEE